jgi:hypothetical protein
LASEGQPDSLLKEDLDENASLWQYRASGLGVGRPCLAALQPGVSSAIADIKSEAQRSSNLAPVQCKLSSILNMPLKGFYDHRPRHNPLSWC